MVLVCLVLGSVNVFADAGDIVLEYKAGELIGGGSIKTCHITNDHSEIKRVMNRLEVLLEEANNGEIATYQHPVSAPVSETFYAYQNGERVLLKSIDSQTEVNVSDAANTFMQIINDVCLKNEEN